MTDDRIPWDQLTDEQKIFAQSADAATQLRLNEIWDLGLDKYR